MRIALLLAVSTLLACAAPAVSSTSGKGSRDRETPSGGFDLSEAESKNGGGGDCSDAAKLVYVVSHENELHSFSPDKGTFERVGAIDCVADGSPNSMAIDRSGTAWVNYSDGSLFKVSTKDAKCTPTKFKLGPEAPFQKFGMAFATDGASSKETLYISGLEFLAGGGYGLGTIDLETFELTMLGDYSGDLKGLGAELTGTGDGHLYGFFVGAPATLAEVDKTKGATSKNQELAGVTTGLAWAFAFWGGDFWFFTSDGLSPSTVTRLDSKTGKTTVTSEDVGGFRVVGAAVSTCAPVALPR